MNELSETAPAFVEMAHRIVWASVATVDAHGRPRSRILHPIWQWDGVRLVGWIGTNPTPTKRAHLNASPYMSLNYWSQSHDTSVAECRAAWAFDDEMRRMVWDLFLNTPEPLGYNPTIIPGWESPTCEAFAAIRLEPWRLRVFPAACCSERAARYSCGERISRLVAVTTSVRRRKRRGVHCAPNEKQIFQSDSRFNLLCAARFL